MIPEKIEENIETYEESSTNQTEIIENEINANVIPQYDDSEELYDKESCYSAVALYDYQAGM